MGACISNNQPEEVKPNDTEIDKVKHINDIYETSPYRTLKKLDNSNNNGYLIRNIRRGF